MLIRNIVNDHNKQKIQRGVLFALASTYSVVILVYFLLFVRSMVMHPTLHHFILLSYVWQTLLAGTFAIVAGVIGFLAVIYQTGQFSREGEDNRARKAAALKATLVLDLAELGEYAAQCAFSTATLLKFERMGHIMSSEFCYPNLPSGISQRMAELIEVIDNEEAQSLIVLLSRLQIFIARISDVKRRTVPSAKSYSESKILLPAYVINVVILAVEIYARGGIILERIRYNTNISKTTLTYEDMHRALYPALDNIQNFAPFAEEIDRIHEINGKKAEWPSF